jgi:hypothetical protein
VEGSKVIYNHSMEIKIHRVLTSAYCTLMLSSAFLTVGDGMLLASAAAGFAAVESKVSQTLSGLDGAGFAGARDWRPSAVQTVQGTARVSPVRASEIIPLLRRTGEPSALEAELVGLLGLRLKPGETDIAVKGRARGSSEQLRLIAAPVDLDREYFIITYENNTANEGYYFLADSTGRLERALVNDRQGIRVVSGSAVDLKYQTELAGWQQALAEHELHRK